MPFELQNFFRACLYPEPILKKLLWKCYLPAWQRHLPPDLIPHYHPSSLAASKIFSHHLNILHSHPVTKVFNRSPRVVNKQDCNMKVLLVRSRLPTHTALLPGTTKRSHIRWKTYPFVTQTPSVNFPRCISHIRESYNVSTQPNLFNL